MVYYSEGGVVLRSAEPRDIEDVHSVANARFGEGYITPETVLHWLEHPDLFIIAEVDGKFAAYLVSVERDAEDIAKEFQLSPAFVTELAGDMPVLQAKSAAVVKKYEKMGLMHHMFRPMMDNAAAHGYHICLASAWKYRGRVPIAKVFAAYGFEPIAEKENLWYNIPGYTCVICGGRCKCPAVIYQYSF